MKRRVKLFSLMVTSSVSVAIMLALNIFIYVYLQSVSYEEFTVLETVLIVIGTILQHHAVNLFIYYILYWPYRRNFLPKTNQNFDVSFYSE